jgi:arginase family enzyme
MFPKSIRVLNFDDTLAKQSKLLERFEPEVFDFSTLGATARLWINEQDAKVLRKFLSAHSKNHITFLGSGDFHHISGLLIEQFSEPISVIIIDNHPDWDVLPPHLGCGSWVSYILRKPNVKEVIIFGPNSGDISTFWIQTANLNALFSGRVCIYPYSHRPTRVFFKSNFKDSCIKTKKSLFSEVIHWHQLKGEDLIQFIPSILSGLSTKKVYVSIDKDCLRARYALTNWEEGSFNLSELTRILIWIKNNLDIVGLDIAGEYSEPKIKGIIKNICSRFDHPRDFSAKDKFPQLIEETNEHTNIALLETLLE